MQMTGTPVWAVLGTSGFLVVELPDHIHRVILAPDGDKAGDKVIDPAAERLTRQGIDVRVSQPPPGKDWCDILGTFEERAAFIEHEAGEDRDQAEREAWAEVFQGKDVLMTSKPHPREWIEEAPPWEPPQQAGPNDDSLMLDPADPLKSARTFLERRHIQDGVITLHHQAGQFYAWNGSCYPLADEAANSRRGLHLPRGGPPPREEGHNPFSNRPQPRSTT